MSDTEGRRRGDGADDEEARPLTAAGRRRRSADSEDATEERAAARTAATRSGGTAVKGRPTAARDGRATTTGSPIARLRRFLREVVAELRKVHWPTRKQIVTYTIVVLLFVSFMVALVAGLDALFTKGVFALFG